MAAVSDILRKRRLLSQFSYPVLAGVKIFAGSLVGITANLAAVPVGHVSCVAVVGFSEGTVDNRDLPTGASQIGISKGTFHVELPGATPADIGKAVFATDDSTFTLTAGTALKAGILAAIDADGVWLTV